MTSTVFYDCIGRSPVIAAVHEDLWTAALASPVEIIFHLKASLLTVNEHITAAHESGKLIMIHIDLADGLGKDRAGIEFLSGCGVDGIISTRGHLIKQAHECGLLTVQRFFALDSQGMDSMAESMEVSRPDLIEIMPGVVTKAVRRFAAGSIPVIAGGLIQTKTEVTDAISAGASAVSTGKETLWYL